MSEIPAAPPHPDDRVFIGRIVKLRGLRGDLKIQPLTWRPERFLDLEGLWVRLPSGEERYLTYKRVRVERNMVYVRFNEAPLRELAEPLVGAEIFVASSQRDPLPEGYYYLDDLEGCEVHDSRYGLLGRIEEVMDMPANDVWRVVGPRGEVLIPAVRHMVDEVDVANRTVKVSIQEGLLPEEQEDAE